MNEPIACPFCDALTAYRPGDGYYCENVVCAKAWCCIVSDEAAELRAALSPEEWAAGETQWPTVALATTRGGSVSVWNGLSDGAEQMVEVDESDRHALAPPARAMTNAERIVCGHSSPDPETEGRFVAMRAAGGHADDGTGCGRAGVWTFMFRCVECGRFFHRDCIAQHFAVHTAPLAASVQPTGAGETAQAIQRVAQEDPKGCAVACLAMVSSRSYVDVRGDFQPAHLSYGLADGTVLWWLNREGFFSRRSWMNGEGGRPAPTSGVAIMLTHDEHWVVLVDGIVLDPARSDPLPDYDFRQAIEVLAARTPDERGDAARSGFTEDDVRLVAKAADTLDDDELWAVANKLEDALAAAATVAPAAAPHLTMPFDDQPDPPPEACDWCGGWKGLHVIQSAVPLLLCSDCDVPGAAGVSVPLSAPLKPGTEGA